MPDVPALTPARPPRPHRLRLAACAAALSLGGLAGFFAWRSQIRHQLLDLEQQLAFAQRADDRAAVGEIARRLTRLDHTPDRLLAVSFGLLQARLFDDLDATLAAVEQAAPQRHPEVTRLRALSAAARADWDDCTAHWVEYVDDPAVTASNRIEGLDELVGVLVKRGQWDRARVRSDERLGLADAPEARLTRAHIALRLRQWDSAREDFRLLKTMAAAVPAVRDALPAWERAERVLPALQSADEAVSASPRDPRRRLERALLCARTGLWQNAADDLQQVAVAVPSARMPTLFGAVLGLPRSFVRPPAADAVDPLTPLPWLAPSTVLAGLLDRFDGQWPRWEQLLLLDTQLAAGGSDHHARAERARLLCELGFAEPALEEARTLLQEQPGFLPAHAVAILALLRRGEIAQASAQVERAITAQSEEPGEADPELQRLFALVWQAQGRHADAVETFTACLRVCETRPDLLRARAKSLRQLQRFTEAAQDLATAERLEADQSAEEAK